MTPLIIYIHRDAGAATRTLPHQIVDTVNMTVANCLNLCNKYGYTAGGLEYGQECCELTITFHVCSL
jgi:hypothetical protein